MNKSHNVSAVVAAAALILLLAPAVKSQGFEEEILSCFPKGTAQVTYADLSELRGLPDYGRLRGILFSLPIQRFEGLFRQFGADPERDVDKVALGWRDPTAGDAMFFGLAEGRFHPARVQGFMTREHLPSEEYGGYLLSTFGSGAGPDDLFFTYLGPSLAAFGRLSDLKALVDGYLGNRITMSSNAQMADWEAKLEGSGPQWGITTGKAAAHMATPWLGGGPKAQVDLSSLFAPVQAILYEADWNNDFSAQIEVVCQTPQNAQALAQLLKLVRDATSSAVSRPPEMTSFIQRLQIDTDGRRIELAASGPPEVVSEFLSGNTAR
ncbi:MAG: hypothetical protein ACRD10_09470 [Terriglobia bacterium]